MPKTKYKPVCVPCVGGENVRVLLRPGTGGEFFLSPDDGGTPCVVLGSYGGRRDLRRICGVLGHELFELLASRYGHRYDQSPVRSGSHAAYWFMLDHEEMDFVVQAVSVAVFDVLPALRGALR
jgi:hypothetical protein